MSKKKSLKNNISGAMDDSYKNKDEGGITFASYLNYKSLDIEKFKDENEKDYIIDLIPFEVKTDKHPDRKIGDSTYHLNIWVHKSIGPDKGNYLCMKNTYKDEGHICPICNEFLRLQGNGYDWEDIKHLYPSKRSIYLIKYKNKKYIYDTSFKIFEELWLEERYRLKRKGKNVLPIYDNDKDCTSLEFSTTDKKGIGRYIQFKFPEIEDFDETFLENNVSLETLLVIPDQEKLEKIFSKIDSTKIEEDDDIEDTEEDEENDYYSDVIENEEDEEVIIEDIEEDEEMEESPPKKERKKKKKKEEHACPYNNIFGVDFDDWEDCDFCKEEHEETHKVCKSKKPKEGNE